MSATAAKLNRYTLGDFTNLIFNGFNYELPDETIQMISHLALEVGSPDYVKTPVFQKRENPMKVDIGNFSNSNSNSNSNSSSSITLSSNSAFKKRKGGNKNMEINDSDWDA